MNRTAEAFTMMLLCFTAACSMPETRIYSIFMEHDLQSESTHFDTPLIIQMNSEHYLRQPYIAYRSSPYHLDIAKYSRWESSPHRTVRKEFRDALIATGYFSDIPVSTVSQKNSYTLRIALSKFERHDEGGTSYAVLEFDAGLFSPEGHGIYSNTVARKAALDGGGFEHLAEVMSLGLKREIDKTVAAITEALRKQVNTTGTDDSRSSDPW